MIGGTSRDDDDGGGDDVVEGGEVEDGDGGDISRDFLCDEDSIVDSDGFELGSSVVSGLASLVAAGL